MQTVSLRSTFAEALNAAQRQGAVVVVDENGRAAGVIGDEEIRRALLRSVPPSADVQTIMNPAFPAVGDAAELFEIRAILTEGRHESAVRVDASGVPLELISRADVGAGAPPVDTAVLMVGGEGQRLRPLTANTPKPLLPVAGKPILDHIIEHLVRFGVKRVYLAVGYLAEQIEERYGNGRALGVDIAYIREPRPLGTAGAISLARLPIDRPLLVMNGDILTDIDVRAMALWHDREHSAFTMAVRPYHHRVPFGVVRLLESRIVSVEEKPTLTQWTNAGIYLLSPEATAAIPRGGYCDMTVLIESLLRDGRRIAAFPLREYWCDIGRPDDYEAANVAWSERLGR